MTRTLSPAGLKLIKKYEGYLTELPNGDCMAYLDRLAKPNIWTIGYGLTEGVYEGMVLTEEEAEAHLMKELSRHERAVNQLVTVPIAQPHFDALVSFSYNCGTNALKRSTLLKRLNAGRYDEAEAQFKRWNRAGGKVYRGLVRRRKEEAQIFATGTLVLFEDDDEPDPIQWVADASHMPQSVEQSGEVTRTKVAAATAVAAAPAGAAVVEATPPGSFDTAINLANAMGSFAMANIWVVLAVGGVLSVVMLIPHLQSVRVSK